LDPDDTWKIICTFGKDKAIAMQSDQILKELTKIDSLCRPLYAAMLGDAIGAGRSHRQWDEKAILEDILQREEKKFWEPAGIEKEDKDVLALATMAGGIDRESNLPAGITEMVKKDKFSLERYCLMSAGSTATFLRPLEPDIIGEKFVLEHLGPNNAYRDEINEMAWVLSAEKMQSFLLRTLDDFSAHPTLHYLLIRCVRNSSGSEAHLFERRKRVDDIYNELIRRGHLDLAEEMYDA
jgi:hypothetical protein